MYDILIIGCGVTGAATAFELSKYNLKVAILERENDVSMGASKANSAIIHAGFDPENGSLMAKLNVRGTVLAREICEKLDVPYKNCGALVLGFDEEDMKTIRRLKENGDRNGVPGLEVVDQARLRELEPQVSAEAVGALYAPSSAIISPWEYCLAMAETAVRNGTELFLNTEVCSIQRVDSGSDTCYRVTAKTADTEDQATRERCFEARYIVNASGCSAGEIHDMVAAHSFEMRPSRGQYFLMDKEEHVRAAHTIFQCPNEHGKGVLVSPTVHGNLIVGPNSEFVDGEDKATTTGGLNYVRGKAAKSVPSIDFRNSIRNFAGVRARTDREDFIIEEVPDAPHFIDAAGICSPGLSAAPAIGEYIRELVEKAESANKGSLVKKDNFICERHRTRFKELDAAQRDALIKKNPAFGRVICRCETVTEGEILETFNTPIPPVSVDGVKRRVGAGLGRCQGGFCGPNVVAILAEKLGVSPTEIKQEGAKSWMLTNL